MKLEIMKKVSFLVFVLFLSSCQFHKTNTPGQDSDPVKKIVILYTNDEHGWMEATDKSGGAPGLMGLWETSEGYYPDSHFLILSGGDMWMGPAISTLTEGKSMVEVMNALDYSAAALGNHEFDFTVSVLNERLSEMQFPILATNIRYKKDNKRADFVLPYIIKEINEVSIAIIGLTTTETPTVTKPANVENFGFVNYESALREVIPEIKSQQPELVILIGHICKNTMESLLPTVRELGISVFGGGHCNELFAEQKNGVVMIQGGGNLENYAKVEIFFDDQADSIVSIAATTHKNIGGTPDIEIENIIRKWRAYVDDALTEIIGYTSKEIPEFSTEMHNMIIDSWLYVYPSADIAFTNTGGIRQSIPVGEVTIETIFGLLPFENSILELDLSGKEVIDCIQRDLIFSGLNIVKEHQLKNGNSIHPDSVYQVLVTDFIYSLPTTDFSKYDDRPYNTGINYRQPLIDWLKAMKSSDKNPINKHLDYVPRR